LLWIVLFSVCLANIDEVTKVVIDHLNDTSIPEERIHSGIVIISSLYVTINAINLIASILLIFGTIKERHLLLLPWLINSGVSLFFNGLYFITILVLGISVGSAFSSVAVSIISGGISLALQIFIWYGMYSLFKQIQCGRDQRQYLLHHNRASYPSYTNF
ncbi:uncharacterized protein LOC119665456, partial [Teleopsis dalmanni]|uniref:uncharacterized protein LOC119665456 n=1 Tax=Teleopsis dalmanni TaxID=139649 RepID=UPI0018CDD0D4